MPLFLLFDRGFFSIFDTKKWKIGKNKGTFVLSVFKFWTDINLIIWPILKKNMPGARFISGSWLEKCGNKGALKNYVDKILPIIDHLPNPCWHLWRNFFTEIKEKSTHCWHFQSHLPIPTSFFQRSLWMPPNSNDWQC